MSKYYDKHDRDYTQRYPQESEPVSEIVEVVEEPIKPVKKETKVCDCDYLNLRKSPSLDAVIITVLKAGTKLTVESDENGWAKVKAENGKFGYVVSDYISK